MIAVRNLLPTFYHPDPDLLYQWLFYHPLLLLFSEAAAAIGVTAATAIHLLPPFYRLQFFSTIVMTTLFPSRSPPHQMVPTILSTESFDDGLCTVSDGDGPSSGEDDAFFPRHWRWRLPQSLVISSFLRHLLPLFFRHILLL